MWRKLVVFVFFSFFAAQILSMDCAQEKAVVTQKYEQLSTDGCYDLEAKDFSESIYCELEACIWKISEFVGEIEEFKQQCPEEEFEENMSTNLLVLQELHTVCNHCVVKFIEFKIFESQIMKNNCWIGSNNCDPSCNEALKEYSSLFEKFFDDEICSAYMPGGCGSTGGVTEGKVYDILTDSMEINYQVQTTASMCSCADDINKWYGGWKSLTEGEEICMSVEGLDSWKNITYAIDIKVVAVCYDECKEKIHTLEQEFYVMPNECRVGMTEVHKDDLSRSLHPKFCPVENSDYDDDSYLDMLYDLNVAAVGAILIFVLIISYCLLGCVINRCVRGKRGYNQIPHYTTISSYCCSSKKKTKTTNLYEDEEPFVLDDEDDNL